jgi:hypothetical protein
LNMKSMDIPSISFPPSIFCNFVLDLNSYEFIEFIFKEIQFGEFCMCSFINEEIRSIFSMSHF